MELSDEPITSYGQIQADPEFVPKIVSEQKFERIWLQAISRHQE
jgi:hypothetical protein